MTPAQILSRFPPSFDGNPWTYGFALFSLTLISAISLAILTGYALEAKTKREISRRVGNYLKHPVSSDFSPIDLHRMVVAGFLLTIFVGATPDTLIMLAWGEASDRVMDTLFLIDRVGDGLALFPFLFSITLMVWAGQAVDHILAIDAVPMVVRPKWSQLRERLKMAAIVFLIAIGVTLAKSVA